MTEHIWRLKNICVSMIKRESKMHINRNKINQDGIEIYINQGNDLYAGCINTKWNIKISKIICTFLHICSHSVHKDYIP